MFAVAKTRNIINNFFIPLSVFKYVGIV